MDDLGSMALTIPGTMTVGSMWKTANTLTLSVPDKMCTGTVTGAFTTHDFRESPEQPDFSFEEIERMYYYEHYSDHVDAQNARNEKTRHTERNRTVDDLLKNNKTCPEESIYQIGTIEESVPPGTLALIVSEFYEEFERRFGSHIHILDWAPHLDEGTPHIHERHVFDCKNRYGELCPPAGKGAGGTGG